jgi:hypothetical protein
LAEGVRGMSPVFGGKSVTNEEYLHLSAKNQRLSPPTAEAIAHAQHEDTGCWTCTDNHESAYRQREELAKLEDLRALYAVGVLGITQKLREWEGADKRGAQGLEALATPTAEDRLVLITKALKSLDSRGMREWKK